MANAPESIQNLLMRTSEIVASVRQQTTCDCLGGPIVIEGRRNPQQNTQHFILKVTPFSYHPLNNEEGKRWKMNGLLSRPNTSVCVQDGQELLRLCEDALFQIYSKSGYGSLSLDCKYDPKKAKHKFELLWFWSNRVAFEL